MFFFGSHRFRYDIRIRTHLSVFRNPICSVRVWTERFNLRFYFAERMEASTARVISREGNSRHQGSNASKGIFHSFLWGTILRYVAEIFSGSSNLSNSSFPSRLQKIRFWSSVVWSLNWIVHLLEYFPDCRRPTVCRWLFVSGRPVHKNRSLKELPKVAEKWEWCPVERFVEACWLVMY